MEMGFYFIISFITEIFYPKVSAIKETFALQFKIISVSIHILVAAT